MGHKVNATSFRLKNIWYDFSFLDKNYSFVLVNLFLRNYILLLGLNQGKLVYGLRILQTVKRTILFFKLYELNPFSKLSQSYRAFIYLLKIRLKVLQNLNLYQITSSRAFTGQVRLVRRDDSGWKCSEGERSLKRRFRFIYNFKTLLNSILYGFQTQSFELIIRVICFFFRMNLRRQWLFFRIVKKIILFVILGQTEMVHRVQGFRFEVKGRIGGRMRKKKFRAKGGYMPLNDVMANIFYRGLTTFTKFGVYGFKFWFFCSTQNPANYQFFFSFRKFRAYLVQFKKFHVKAKQKKIQKRISRKISI